MSLIFKELRQDRLGGVSVADWPSSLSGFTNQKLTSNSHLYVQHGLLVEDESRSLCFSLLLKNLGRSLHFLEASLSGAEAFVCGGWGNKNTRELLTVFSYVLVLN